MAAQLSAALEGSPFLGQGGSLRVTGSEEKGFRVLLSLGGEDTAKTLRKVARVVQDLGGMVIWADEKQERN